MGDSKHSVSKMLEVHRDWCDRCDGKGSKGEEVPQPRLCIRVMGYYFCVSCVQEMMKLLAERGEG